MSLHSPSLSKTSTSNLSDSSKPARIDSSSTSKTKVELHQADVLLQKEISRLERQQNAAVGNIANHQQAMKMSWRRLEQRRRLDSSLQTTTRDVSLSSPSVKRSIFHSRTQLHAGQNVWRLEPASSLYDTSSVVSEQAVQVTGDIYHRRIVDHGSLPPKHNVSPYLSSPYNVRRSKALQEERNFHSLPSTPNLSNSKPITKHDSGTSDKSTLLKASKLMGLEFSTHSLENFKEFYSTGVETSTASASVLASTALNQSLNASGNTEQETNDEKKSTLVQVSDNDLTMAQMFEQIKNCRYIRHTQPNGLEQ